jgi:hypothetical protein
LVWHKKFGPAQNILGPVKGQQGINTLNFVDYRIADEIVKTKKSGHHSYVV